MLALTTMVVVSCDKGPDTTGPAWRAAELYAPGLHVGEIVSDSARRRYRLVVTPYVGYVDSTYRGPDGFGGLAVVVDEHVDDIKSSVSRSARVKSLGLTADSAAAARATRSRLQAVLGRPKEICYTGTPGQHFRAFYWPGDHDDGVLLVSPRTSRDSDVGLPSGQRSQRDQASLTLGTGDPSSMDGISLEPCIED